ncbi:hypothetical protein DXT99_22910 [Pontibacter diazotrophicus]|uniref:Uncharacterized protein n=1 Tax=Pontibacter diazotrophicus TaxID=1400979 RepID=A0A3D8L3I4_9BACT|nr:hypothetical protein DXT99_22910 [Pontibacter diazotrophicus]
MMDFYSLIYQIEPLLERHENFYAPSAEVLPLSIAFPFSSLAEKLSKCSYFQIITLTNDQEPQSTGFYIATSLFCIIKINILRLFNLHERIFTLSFGNQISDMNKHIHLNHTC